MRISDPNHENAEELQLLFQRLRGAAVSSFAEAEFAMGDIIGAMEAAGSEPKVVYSHKVEKRLLAFKEICLFHAGDDEIRKRVEWATLSFGTVIQDRHALVHGSAKLFPNERKVEVLKLTPKKGQNHSVSRFIFDLNLLESRVSEFDRISRNIVGLSWLLADKLGLRRDSEPGIRVVLTDYE